MVTRKPVGPPLATANTSQQQSSSNASPPYPTTPTIRRAETAATSSSVYSTDLASSPAFDLIDMHEARQRSRSDSDASSNGTWDSDGSEPERGKEQAIEVPKPLNVKASQINPIGTGRESELPAILRPGPAQAGKNPKNSAGGQPYREEAQGNPWAEAPKPGGRRESGPLESNNPYLKQNGFPNDNSQSEWREARPSPPPPPANAPPPPPPQPMTAPPPPPVELSSAKSPTQEFSQMSLDTQRPASFTTAEVLAVPQQGQPPLPPVAEHGSATTSQARPLSTWWQDSEPHRQDEAERPPPGPQPEAPQQQLPAPQYAPPPGPPPGQPSTTANYVPASGASSRSRPPPISTAQPGRPMDSVPETPQTTLKKQRNEFYQIKLVNWFDESRPGMRRTPILTQNANGPCPLLALVNALVLSTPHDLDTALVDTLSTREQVSLGLLLDAVFDELMSGRRGDTASSLPDVSELYSFLLALHTGMNVNPRFATPAMTPGDSSDGHPSNLSAFHPKYREQQKAGGFEETREMRLYSTFNIPLIHGWMAPVDTPAYNAFLRSAQTFEDAQNIQFAEAELEDKLRSEGLGQQEQQTLQDIHTINAFLQTWPTQLTDYGLQAISQVLAPGHFAILFRNDHFSTVYKEPTHGALMTLVTDAGYGSHDEIVWESLVDVNGSASEMFSGDFRTVSHNQDARLNQGNSSVRTGQQYGAAVASGASANQQEAPPPLPGPRPTSQGPSQPGNDGMASELSVPASSDAQRKASEQEDHDLALALQLQEEEEDQQRQAEERRRREQELSEQFLSNENEGPRPPIPPRRSNNNSNTTRTGTTPRTGRAPVNRPSDSPDDPDAPPSYEQAASDRPYRPAGSTAASSMSQGNPLGAYDALRRQQSAYAAQSTSTLNSQTGDTPPGYAASPTHNRRQSTGNRIRRQSSQVGAMTLPARQPNGVHGMYLPPGSFAGSSSDAAGSSSPGRINQAAGVKDTDERCVVM